LEEGTPDRSASPHYVERGRTAALYDKRTQGVPRQAGPWKAVLTKQKQEAEGTDSELQALLRNYKPEWESKLDPDFISRAYEDVETIWRTMLEAGQINVIESISHGSRTITFLAHVEQQPERAADFENGAG
jgi:hypothetical protein